MPKTKKLFRSKKDRFLAGICAGIGEYLEVDPTIVRVVFVLLTLITGIFPGLIFYFILWVIIPEE
ncbi:MAG: PspC domain-containing protein [Patescibacteria group bacterium]|nr:PspC domain-containing protein [Patescibacteria group bacterium]